MKKNHWPLKKFVIYFVSINVLSACAQLSLNPEPELVPTVYITLKDSCNVSNSENPLDVINPQSPKWVELYCAPFNELLLMKQKNQKCEKWGK